MIRDDMRFRLGDVTLDRDRRGLFRGRDAVHVSPRACRLLELLVDRRPGAVSRREILDTLRPDVVVSDGSIAVLVNEVRKALGDDARAPRWVRTLPAFGYALDGTVREETAPVESAKHSVVWAGTTIALGEGENVLGRDPSGGVLVGHPSVSRRHAKVVVEGLQAVLEDLGSRNGTWVATKRVEESVTPFDGDQIVLGSATLTYRGPAAGASKETVSRR